ncbi:MAG: hypothetical protein QMC96_08065 [Methanomicrobiales archaeon]|nr:hypothetical protein [Methanomicrobiales archaeon]
MKTRTRHGSRRRVSWQETPTAPIIATRLRQRRSTGIRRRISAPWMEGHPPGERGEAMSIRYVPVLLLLLAAALVASGCTFPRGIPGPLVTEESDQAYPVDGMQRLDVENLNGAVRVAGWDQPFVSVRCMP